MSKMTRLRPKNQLGACLSSHRAPSYCVVPPQLAVFACIYAHLRFGTETHLRQNGYGLWAGGGPRGLVRATAKILYFFLPSRRTLFLTETCPQHRALAQNNPPEASPKAAPPQRPRMTARAANASRKHTQREREPRLPGTTHVAMGNARARHAQCSDISLAAREWRSKPENTVLRRGKQNNKVSRKKDLAEQPRHL